MAFFQNTKANSIVGVSLPVDGSDSITLHLLVRDLQGQIYHCYDDEKNYLSTLEGAETVSTSSGCMITFSGNDYITKALDHIKPYVNDRVMASVQYKRKYATQESLQFKMSRSSVDEISLQVLDYFKHKKIANLNQYDLFKREDAPLV